LVVFPKRREPRDLVDIILATSGGRHESWKELFLKMPFGNGGGLWIGKRRWDG
jgi:hypothetical protein